MPVTPEELLVLPEGKHCELVDGAPLTRPIGMRRAWIIANLSSMICAYLDRNPIGKVFGSGASYQCFPHDPFMVRRADISFIRVGRLPREQFLRGHARIVPDLVVEVIPSSDQNYDISRKLTDYFSTEISLIWLVNPETRTVTIYREGGKGVILLRDDEQLTGDDILPGFSVAVANLFPPPITPQD